MRSALVGEDEEANVGDDAMLRVCVCVCMICVCDGWIQAKSRPFGHCRSRPASVAVAVAASPLLSSSSSSIADRAASTQAQIYTQDGCQR